MKPTFIISFVSLIVVVMLGCMMFGCVMFGCSDGNTKHGTEQTTVVEKHQVQLDVQTAFSWRNPALCYGTDFLNAVSAMKRNNPANEKVLLKFTASRSIKELGEKKVLRW